MCRHVAGYMSAHGISYLFAFLYLWYTRFPKCLKMEVMFLICIYFENEVTSRNLCASEKPAKTLFVCILLCLAATLKKMEELRNYLHHCDKTKVACRKLNKGNQKICIYILRTSKKGNTFFHFKSSCPANIEKSKQKKRLKRPQWKFSMISWWNYKLEVSISSFIAFYSLAVCLSVSLYAGCLNSVGQITAGV